MSEENMELVRRLGEVWLESGIGAMAERFLDPEVEYEDDPSWPDYRTARGRDAVVTRFEDWSEAWDAGVEATVERIAGKDSRVVAIFLMRMEGTSSGVPQSHRWGYVFELRDGLVLRFSIPLKRSKPPGCRSSQQAS